MRVYNGTNLQLSLPLAGTQRIEISAHSVSGDIMPSTEFLSLLVGSYDYSEIALIVSGPFEINMCAGVSGSVGFVVQSLEEAIERFSPKASIEESKKADESECCGCHSDSCEGCGCMAEEDVCECPMPKESDSAAHAEGFPVEEDAKKEVIESNPEPVKSAGKKKLRNVKKGK